MRGRDPRIQVLFWIASSLTRLAMTALVQFNRNKL